MTSTVSSDIDGRLGNFKSDPETIKASVPKAPMLIVSLENTSRIGIPEISLTAKRDPESESVTENNCP